MKIIFKMKEIFIPRTKNGRGNNPDPTATFALACLIDGN